MKRFTAIWIICMIVSIGSFAALVAEDRQLGVPLPYSVPLAFAALQIVAGGLLALSERLRANRPVVVRVVERRARKRRDGYVNAGGSVLLDVSTVAIQGQPA